MDFNKAKQEAAEEAATDKWDKARLFAERMTFCIRTIEEIDNPWFHDEKDPVSVYQLVIGFLVGGHRQTAQTTYRITPEMRLLVGRHPAPWHNMRLSRYQTKGGSYGYELDQVTADDAVCAWERAAKGAASTIGKPGQDGYMLSAGDVVEGSIQETSEALQSLGFEPVETIAPFESGPVSDETWQALTRASLLLKSTFNLVVIPPEREGLNDYDARVLLDSMRKQWAAQSVERAKTSTF
jgi:hypothetical protein